MPSFPCPSFNKRQIRFVRHNPKLYSHRTAVHTPAGAPPAPVKLRSRKFPAATATLPVATQASPGPTEQESPASAILPGVPCRSVTWIVFVCCENTLNCDTVHPAGTHVITAAVSPASAFVFAIE